MSSNNNWTPLAMQTGFSNVSSTGEVNTEFLKRIKGIMLHFMERAVIMGSEYAVAAGRDIVTSTDILYALQYQARTYLEHVANTPDIESVFDKYSEEVEEESSDSEEESSDSEEVEDSEEESSEVEEEEFTRCENPTDPVMADMNRYHDTWDDWKPDNPFQQLLKNAVDHAFIE